MYLPICGPLFKPSPVCQTTDNETESVKGCLLAGWLAVQRSRQAERDYIFPGIRIKGRNEDVHSFIVGCGNRVQISLECAYERENHRCRRSVVSLSFASVCESPLRPGGRRITWDGMG